MEQQELFPNEELVNLDNSLKKCISCHRDLPLNCYKPVGGCRRVDGTPKLRNKCDSCCKQDQKQRDILLKITPRPDNNYKCPICFYTEGQFSKATVDASTQNLNASWCLDHDHITGKFRGWLCHKCNSALGWFNDDINYLRRAVKYLENSA
tara:strand:- start:27 stop:479 length:453 start_codon:yes stop_codon:yes gene_type:complete